MVGGRYSKLQAKCCAWLQYYHNNKNLKHETARRKLASVCPLKGMNSRISLVRPCSDDEPLQLSVFNQGLSSSDNHSMAAGLAVGVVSLLLLLALADVAGAVRGVIAVPALLTAAIELDTLAFAGDSVALTGA